jgi:hypothetical protein
MPQFKVPIWGKDLERARQALHDAGIKTTAGPDRLRGVRRVLRLGHQMLALLDADSDEEAEARVKDNLPDDDYDVGAAEPWGG